LEVRYCTRVDPSAAVQAYLSFRCSFARPIGLQPSPDQPVPQLIVPPSASQRSSCNLTTSCTRRTLYTLCGFSPVPINLVPCRRRLYRLTASHYTTPSLLSSPTSALAGVSYDISPSYPQPAMSNPEPKTPKPRYLDNSEALTDIPSSQWTSAGPALLNEKDTKQNSETQPPFQTPTTAALLLPTKHRT
jgi:hypothetical protein